MQQVIEQIRHMVKSLVISSKRQRRVAEKSHLRAALCMSIGALTMLLLTSCTKTVDLSHKQDALASKELTQGGEEAIFPDDRPSLTNGKIVWQQANCAQCHGVDGTNTVGNGINLASKEYMRRQKPVDMYMFVTYGTSGINHPKLHGILSRRQIWDLVFYARSLATPPLTDKEYEQVDTVFGSNCAVCHGKKGYGDGPLAHNLEPVPANFKQFNRFYDRTDALLWDHIAHGIKWEGMPNFLGKTTLAGSTTVQFDQDYIWKLVQYVRQFQQTTDTTASAHEENEEKSEQPKSTQ